MENLENEIWKDVKGYEGLYQISSFGNVRTPFKLSYNGKKLKPLIMKKSKNGNGYYTVTLRKNNKQTTFTIHRLVALNFLENNFNYNIVNHKDHNILNNHFTNLEWVSPRENCCHGRLKYKSTSKYIGVHYDSNRNKWQSSLRYGNKRIFLGRFDSEIDAYNARLNYDKKNGIINKYI